MNNENPPTATQTKLQVFWVWIRPKIRPFLIEVFLNADLLFSVSIGLIVIGIISAIWSLTFVRLLLIGDDKPIGWYPETVITIILISGFSLFFYVCDRNPEKKAAVTRFIHLTLQEFHSRTPSPQFPINHHIITVGKVTVAYHLQPEVFVALSQNGNSDRKRKAAMEAKLQEVNTKLTTILTADQKAELTKFQAPLGIVIVAVDSPYLREVPTIPPPEKPKPPRIVT